MLLSAHFLNDVGSVNVYQYDDELAITSGNATTIYFQLIDASVNKSGDGFNPPGRRYMPASGATLTVTFTSINDDNEVERLASQPYADDKSIWSVSVLASDEIEPGTVVVELSLSEGGVTKTGKICTPLRVY